MCVLNLSCRIILSPAEKKKIQFQLWQRDKVFDAILALTLPCELSHNERGRGNN